jgi:hypothetical protein
VVNASGPWFSDEGVRLSNAASATSLSITIVIQRTAGLVFSGQYNTVGGQVLQSSASTPSTVTYRYALASGQTLAPGTAWLFDAQAGGAGTAHPPSGDTFTVTYTVAGVTVTETGHF